MKKSLVFFIYFLTRITISVTAQDSAFIQIKPIVDKMYSFIDKKKISKIEITRFIDEDKNSNKLTSLIEEMTTEILLSNSDTSNKDLEIRQQNMPGQLFGAEDSPDVVLAGKITYLDSFYYVSFSLINKDGRIIAVQSGRIAKSIGLQKKEKEQLVLSQPVKPKQGVYSFPGYTPDAENTVTVHLYDTVPSNHLVMPDNYVVADYTKIDNAQSNDTYEIPIKNNTASPLNIIVSQKSLLSPAAKCDNCESIILNGNSTAEIPGMKAGIYHVYAYYFGNTNFFVSNTIIELGTGKPVNVSIDNSSPYVPGTWQVFPSTPPYNSPNH